MVPVWSVISASMVTCRYIRHVFNFSSWCHWRFRSTKSFIRNYHCIGVVGVSRIGTRFGSCIHSWFVKGGIASDRESTGTVAYQSTRVLEFQPISDMFESGLQWLDRGRSSHVSVGLSLEVAESLVRRQGYRDQCLPSRVGQIPCFVVIGCVIPSY